MFTLQSQMWVIGWLLRKLKNVGVKEAICLMGKDGLYEWLKLYEIKVL